MHMFTQQSSQITNPQIYHIPSSHSDPRSPLNAAKQGTLRTLGRHYGNTLTMRSITITHSMQGLFFLCST